MSDLREDSREAPGPIPESSTAEEGPADRPEAEGPSAGADGTGTGPAAPEEAAAGPAPADGFERAIEALGDRLSQRLEAIRMILERDARAEATRERVVDRLHAELQEYKQDLLLRVQRPIFIDLIQLHDDIGKMIEARGWGDGDGERHAAVRGVLESIQVAIEDILYRQGVEPFAAEGESFDPRRQRAVATVTTDDLGRNKAIAARLRKGFSAGEKLIRPELVSVYTYRPPSPEEPPG